MHKAICCVLIRASLTREWPYISKQVGVQKSLKKPQNHLQENDLLKHWFVRIRQKNDEEKQLHLANIDLDSGDYKLVA